MSTYNPNGVEVSLNGETRQLLFDYNIIAEIQEKYDSSVLNVLRTTQEIGGIAELNATLLKNLLHILLEGERQRRSYFGDTTKLKSYTPREIGFLVSKANDNDIWNAILNAWLGSLPELTQQDQVEDEMDKELAIAEGRDPNSQSGTSIEG